MYRRPVVCVCVYVLRSKVKQREKQQQNSHTRTFPNGHHLALDLSLSGRHSL